MKIRDHQLQERIDQVGSEIRGVEPLNKEPSAPPPEVDRAVQTAVKAMVDEIVEQQTKFRDRDFLMNVLSHMRRAVEGWPKEASEKIWSFGDGPQLQDKLQAELKAQLAAHGLIFGKVSFEHGSYDSGRDMYIKGVRPGTPEPSAEATKLTEGPKTGKATADQRTAKHMLSSAKELLDEATHLLATSYQNPYREKYQGSDDPKLMHKVTVALEKVAKQLASVNIAPELGRAEGISGDLRSLQQSYVGLLYQLVGSRDLYRDAARAEVELGRMGKSEYADIPGENALRWVISALSIAKNKTKGEAVGNYERRVQEALISIYANAPVFGASENKTPALDFVMQTFSLATPELLRDPANAAVFKKAAFTAEAAVNAEAANNHQRAKHAYRDVATTMLHNFGLSLVSAEAIIKLGDFEARFGRNDRASRAYVGAMRILKKHLPDDHVLVRETAKKLDQTGNAWLKSLDQNKSEPMPYEARYALADAESIRKELGLDAILAQTGPGTTRVVSAGPEQWTAALDAAKPGENKYWQGNDEAEKTLFWNVHRAVVGPMRD